MHKKRTIQIMANPFAPNLLHICAESRDLCLKYFRSTYTTQPERRPHIFYFSPQLDTLLYKPSSFIGMVQHLAMTQLDLQTILIPPEKIDGTPHYKMLKWIFLRMEEIIALSTFFNLKTLTVISHHIEDTYSTANGVNRKPDPALTLESLVIHHGDENCLLSSLSALRKAEPFEITGSRLEEDCV